MKTINVVGCGNVGKTLARLWTRHHVFAVQSILNRSLESGLRAAEFVGSGRAVESYAQMERADLVMISTSGGAIRTCCERLCRAGVLEQGMIVFHVRTGSSCRVPRGCPVCHDSLVSREGQWPYIEMPTRVRVKSASRKSSAAAEHPA